MLFLLKVFILAVLIHESYSQLSKYQIKCGEYGKLVKTYMDDPTGVTEDKIEVDNCVNAEALIHGGEDALPMEFPFMALVGFGDEAGINWKCGGSLISEQFVLSAAHCSYNFRLGNATWVRLGDLDVSSSTDDADPVNIPIKERIVYKGYTQRTKYDDIVLFRLAHSVTFNKYIRPICLYGGAHLDHQPTIISGWGATHNGTFSPTLQKANVKLNTESDCKGSYSQRYLGLPKGLNWTSMVCAKGVTIQDSCRGDSGGPLFTSINNEHYCMMAQVGITSFGKECDSGNPGVYTRVSNYIPWIESVVWPNSITSP